MQTNLVLKEITIGVLVCYFGKLPWYFDYYIHSCKYNPTIDFFIVTDNIYTKELPINVTIINKTIEDVKHIASEKLGFEVCIDYAYKLCDFKPAYGLIFSDILGKYDFWGQTDIDIIYGDIRYFMDQTMLSSYDFISVRHDYTTGCFALYRNNYLINNLFKRSKDFIKVFSGREHFCFDECNFVHDLLIQDNESMYASISIFEIPTEIESFTHIVKRAQENCEIRAHFDFLLMEGVVGRLKFVNGKIIYRNTFEVMLYHLYWLKRIYNPTHTPKVIPNIYKISPTRIYT